MKLITVCLVVFALITLLTVSVAADEVKEFIFRDFLLDKTEYFSVQTANMGTNGLVYDNEQPLRKLFLNTKDGSDMLTATTHVNTTKVDAITEELSDVFNFVVNFETGKNNTGTIVLENTKTVQFAFTTIERVSVSNGKWNDETNYQIVVPGPDRFIITLFDSKNGQIRQIFVAKKILIDVPKTFFQAYGSYILMAVMLTFNMWMQNKPQPEENQEQGAEAGSQEKKMVGPQKPVNVQGAKAKKD
jgi:hypothetical protein